MSRDWLNPLLPAPHWRKALDGLLYVTTDMATATNAMQAVYPGNYKLGLFKESHDSWKWRIFFESEEEKVRWLLMYD